MELLIGIQMANLHVTQIKNKFQEYFSENIDISDVSNRDMEYQDNILCTRSLSAYAISIVARADYDTAAKSVTDEPNDGGIDAIFFDQDEKILNIVQSKWSNDGKAQINQEAMLKFLSGVGKLIAADYDKFLVRKADDTTYETKVYKKREEVQSALKDPRAKFRLVFAYTGVEPIQSHAMGDLNAFIDEQNQASEVIKVEYLDLTKIHKALDQHLIQDISPTVEIFEWGRKQEPYDSYFGQISGSQIASLFNEYGVHLFSPNLRVFMGNTPVNEDIINTAITSPSNFWYFNNGITALCESIEKLPYGGQGREFGIFKCNGLAIVNGAQTVGSLFQAFQSNSEAVEKTRVTIRLISLQNCPPGEGDLITKYTNTQNGIGKKDFAALDKRQIELQRVLRIDNISYAVKSGESITDLHNGFDFNEGMVALACAHPDLGMAVTAKREVSKLWDDITKPPYLTLVNSILGPELWKLVKIQRVIDKTIYDMEASLSGRPSLILIHGNRLIAHLVFSLLRREEGASFKNTLTFSTETVEEHTKTISKKLIRVMQDPNVGYADSYPGSLFKNRTKCQNLINDLNQLT